MDYNRDYFKGKTAVVTGGAGGIGLALTEELLESGAAKVVIADIRQDRLDEALEKLHSAYDAERVKAIQCDVTKEDQVQSLITQAAAYFDGSFDILFNNAGAAFEGWFDDMTNEDWEIAFNLNFYSALYGMRAVIPIMKAQGGGQIINTISGIAFVPMSKQTRYAATKAALNGLSLAMRAEYWDDNIKISPATPGTTATYIFTDAGFTAPPSAQTPHQSASRILHGVVNNDRIILGDDGDVSGASYGFHPEAAKNFDDYSLMTARERRQGIVDFHV